MKLPAFDEIAESANTYISDLLKSEIIAVPLVEMHFLRIPSIAVHYDRFTGRRGERV